MGENEKSPIVMVVDDQENNREILQLVLGWKGCVVQEASNGLEAVKLAAKECPDLIIMDLAMPIMDGFTAVRLLRKLPECTHVPVVAYTAHDTPTHRAYAFETGFNEFLAKPLDFQKLESVLDRFIRK
jgi:CheY-like chemotaxis protein